MIPQCDSLSAVYLTTLTFVRCGYAPFVKVGCTSALASAELIQQWPRRATKVETCGPNGGIEDEVTVTHRRWLPVSSTPGNDVVDDAIDIKPGFQWIQWIASCGCRVSTMHSLSLMFPRERECMVDSHRKRSMWPPPWVDVDAMSIYPKRAALPSPSRNWAGADRPQPFSTRFASLCIASLWEDAYAGLKSSRMVLTGVGTREVATERQALSTDSRPIWQEWLTRTRSNHIIRNKIRPVDIEVPII